MMNKLKELISSKSITFLKDLDNRIIINKFGKYEYHKIYEIRNQSKIQYFLNELEDNCVYMIIPIISANDNSTEPFITLSRQILVTNKSNHLLIWNFINDKIIESIDLYEIKNLNSILIFKFKKVQIEFKENNSF